MAYRNYHKRKIADRELHPETQMMSYGYDPFLSEGSVKPPVFLTSTFAFRTAEDGADSSTSWPGASLHRKAKARASSTAVSITRTWRSSRIASPCSTIPKPPS